jgi:hypothetical protein
VEDRRQKTEGRRQKAEEFLTGLQDEEDTDSFRTKRLQLCILFILLILSKTLLPSAFH